MKIYRTFRIVFLISSVLLSNAMCAVVAYNYCTIQWGSIYAGYSAPANSAFLYAIPYGAAIALCLLFASLFYRKEIKQV